LIETRKKSGTTEAEAANYGRFLSLVLLQVNKWRSNEEYYNRNLKLSPGFNLNFSTAVPFPFSEFLVRSANDHKQVALGCKLLESKEYLVVRNSLQVLTKIIDAFPLVNQNEKQVDAVWLTVRKKKKKDGRALEFHFVPSERHRRSD
jgi:hypothetical protein